MSETMGNTHHETADKGFIDPIDSLSRMYDGLLREKSAVEQELSKVESDRATAIRQAAAPFDPTIEELTGRMQQITEQQGPQAGREVLESLLVNSTPIYRGSLELLVERYWSNGIEGLITEIGTETRRHSFGSTLTSIKKQLQGIASIELHLEGSSEENSQPVIVFGTHRYEEIDEQAVFDGRDSSTGIFHTDVFGYRGMASAGSLSLETERYLLPGQFGYIERPAALVLRISNAKELQTKPSLIVKNFDNKIAADGSMTVRLLTRKSDGKAPLMPFEWSSIYPTPDKSLRVIIGQEQIEQLKF